MDAPDTAGLQSLTDRFTLDGSPELENGLASICEKLRSGIAPIVPPSRFELLLLGGGYGRGEGGVWRTNEGDKPYNDLEFYLFIDGSQLLMQRLYGGRVHFLAEQLSAEAGIEVEVKIVSLSKVKRSPVTMFYYDLLSGYKCVHGDEAKLQECQHHRAAHRIPLYEATRLLMNRCSGLLFSKERLQRSIFKEAETDFVFRNIAKTKLALGDVILTARGEYHWSCRERHKRLSKLEVTAELPISRIIALHREGVEFKLHPRKTSHSREELAATHSEISELARVVWHWLENRRLHHAFGSTKEYALSGISKCPETLKFKNVLVNARQFGAGTIFEPRSGYYPRERLLNSLPLLLWEKNFTDSPALLAHIQKELRTENAPFPELVEAYETLWKNFN